MKRRFRFAAGVLLCGILCAQQRIPLEPTQNSGQGVTPAYEGYFENPDGSLSLLFGYYNRNAQQVLDIPAGPDNRIEPDGPDRGQPTHFLVSRQWGAFTITVPKGFNQKLTWTLTANGKTAAVPADLNPLYLLAPFQDATGDTPPFIGFAQAGPFVQGPRGQSTTITTTWPNAAPLELWVADDAHVTLGQRPPGTTPVTVSLRQYRGPGAITFAAERPTVEKAEFPAPPGASFTGKVTASATFSTPGEYIVLVTANDWTGVGGGGFQCCWSNAQIKISVKAPASTGR